VKNLVVVCLGVLVVVSAAVPAYSQREEVSPFAQARKIGERPAQTFYLFSTPVNNYTIRHDGVGQVMVKVRKINFHLNVGANSRIERLYFFEHDGELLLLYQAGSSGYFVRFDQKAKMIRSTTAIKKDFEPPLLKDHSLTFTDGRVVPLN
jgi:hypothetical protein